ncbi:unnamed protein product [Diplocarpon coronariae]
MAQHPRVVLTANMTLLPPRSAHPEHRGQQLGRRGAMLLLAVCRRHHSPHEWPDKKASVRPKATRHISPTRRPPASHVASAAPTRSRQDGRRVAASRVPSRFWHRGLLVTDAWRAEHGSPGCRAVGETGEEGGDERGSVAGGQGETGTLEGGLRLQGHGLAAAPLPLLYLYLYLYLYLQSAVPHLRSRSNAIFPSPVPAWNDADKSNMVMPHAS